MRAKHLQTVVMESAPVPIDFALSHTFLTFARALFPAFTDFRELHLVLWIPAGNSPLRTGGLNFLCTSSRASVDLQFRGSPNKYPSPLPRVPRHINFRSYITNESCTSCKWRSETRRIGESGKLKPRSLPHRQNNIKSQASSPSRKVSHRGYPRSVWFCVFRLQNYLIPELLPRYESLKYQISFPRISARSLTYPFFLP